MQKAIFLDRDGVINKELGDYVCKFEDFHIHTYNFDALKTLVKKGYLILVATNQGGIAKGWYSVDELTKMHDHLKKVYSENGIEISGIYYCPHHPLFTGNCDCRKPKPGMLLQGIKDFDLDASQSYFIGDKTTDVDAANAAGVNGILINIDQPLSEILDLIA